MKTKSDNTIDLLKFIFAFFVVGIHTHLTNYIVNPQSRFYFISLTFRLAVPFFFIVSGYYYGKKLWLTPSSKSNKLCSYVSRLFPPLILWSFLTLFFNLPELYARTGYDKHACFILVLKYIFFYPLGAMWFALACIIGACIITLFWKHKIFLCLSAILCYTFGLLGNNYYFIALNNNLQTIIDKYNYHFICTRNGFFIGFPLMFLGAMLAHPMLLQKIKNKILLPLTVFSLFLLLAEIHYLYEKPYYDDRSLFISYLLFIPCLILCALKYNIFPNKNLIVARELSTCIYYTHYFFINLIGFFVRDSIYAYLAVICCSICTYFISTKLPVLKKVL